MERPEGNNSNPPISQFALTGLHSTDEVSENKDDGSTTINSIAVLKCMRAMHTLLTVKIRKTR